MSRLRWQAPRCDRWDVPGCDEILGAFRTPIAQRRPIERLPGPIGRRVRARRRQLVKISALNRLTDLQVFGSVARGEEHDDSDLDLLVDIPEGMGVLALGRARQELEEVVGTTIDLVSSDGLEPGVASHIERDLLPL